MGVRPHRRGESGESECAVRGDLYGSVSVGGLLENGRKIHKELGQLWIFIDSVCHSTPKLNPFGYQVPSSTYMFLKFFWIHHTIFQGHLVMHVVYRYKSL